jgi:uncharacterized protein YodC (DUF2158 family)
VEKKSIKEISVINKLINDEFLPENKQRILDEEFGVGKMTVSDFQKDFLPKWFDFYGTDSKYIDTKAQVEEKYGLTPVQYLKKSNDLKILERNYVKNLTDSLYADMSKDADPETYALFAQQVVDGFKTQFSDVKSSIIKLEGLAENQSFTSAFYSKEEIKEGVKNSYQILDTYKNKWIEYHKYFRE